MMNLEPLPDDVTTVIQDEQGRVFEFKTPFTLWIKKGGEIVHRQFCDEYGNFRTQEVSPMGDN